MGEDSRSGRLYRTLTRRLSDGEIYNLTDGRAGAQVGERLVDLVQRNSRGNQVVEVKPSLHVVFEQVGDIDAKLV